MRERVVCNCDDMYGDHCGWCPLKSENCKRCAMVLPNHATGCPAAPIRTDERFCKDCQCGAGCACGCHSNELSDKARIAELEQELQLSDKEGDDILRAFNEAMTDLNSMREHKDSLFTAWRESQAKLATAENRVAELTARYITMEGEY